MPKRWTYLVAYDSPSDSRRAGMLRLVGGFGMDPQLSFHECRLSAGERRELWGELTRCAKPEQDRLLLLRLDPRSQRWRLDGNDRDDSADGSAGVLTYVG
ncbi:MAG TPA: CRISPR-associated endonuclease Cas2 [Devosia sp.]|nr:CRISPR-associated endonuclease Cas2 [Devosia sp.]